MCTLVYIFLFVSKSKHNSMLYILYFICYKQLCILGIIVCYSLAQFLYLPLQFDLHSFQHFTKHQCHHSIFHYKQKPQAPLISILDASFFQKSYLINNKDIFLTSVQVPQIRSSPPLPWDCHLNRFNNHLMLSQLSFWVLLLWYVVSTVSTHLSDS